MRLTEGLLAFGPKIRELRKGAGFSQQEMGDTIGVTKAMISAYEQGMRFPAYINLIRLAKVFHVTTDYLLGIERTRMVSIDHLNEDQQAAIIQLIGTMSK